MTRLLCLIICLSAAAAASAKPVVYDCTVPRSSAGGGYVQPQIVISHDPARAEAMVYDAAVHHVHGKPIPARITEADDSRLTVAWRLMLSDASGNTTQMAYRAVYLKGPRIFVVSAKPSGYENNFGGRGTCRLK